MKKHLLQIAAIFCLLSSFVFGEVRPGDSIEKMREELGEPTAQIKKGISTAYSFPQGVIFVENGRVVRVSDGFYQKVDQITRQTETGTYELKVLAGSDTLSAQEIAGAESAETVNQQPVVWLLSYEEAKKLSEQEMLPMLILFTKAVDCEDCSELDELILQDDKFNDFARRGIVLLRLDYPIESPGEKLVSLEENFAIEYFPMMVFLDPEGNELGRVDYQYLPPEAYVMMFEQILLGNGERAEEIGRNILRDEFGDAVDRLMFLDSISGSGLLLSAQIFVGCILAFLLIRRLIRK